MPHIQAQLRAGRDEEGTRGTMRKSLPRQRADDGDFFVFASFPPLGSVMTFIVAFPTASRRKNVRACHFSCPFRGSARATLHQRADQDRPLEPTARSVTKFQHPGVHVPLIFLCFAIIARPPSRTRQQHQASGGCALRDTSICQ